MMTVSGLGPMQESHVATAEISRDVKATALGNSSEEGVL